MSAFGPGQLPVARTMQAEPSCRARDVHHHPALNHPSPSRSSARQRSLRARTEHDRRTVAETKPRRWRPAGRYPSRLGRRSSKRRHALLVVGPVQACPTAEQALTQSAPDAINRLVNGSTDRRRLRPKRYLTVQSNRLTGPTILADHEVPPADEHVRALPGAADHRSSEGQRVGSLRALRPRVRSTQIDRSTRRRLLPVGTAVAPRCLPDCSAVGRRTTTGWLTSINSR